MKALIMVKDIVSVSYATKGWTDHLTIQLINDTILRESCYHYEESMRQIDKCKKMKEAYDKIVKAVKNKEGYVEINTGEEL